MSENKNPCVGVPNGWKFVPIEPTEEMKDAAERDWNQYDDHGNTRDSTVAAYAAMIAAAPSAPQAVAAPDRDTMSEAIKACKKVETNAMLDNDKRPSEFKQGIIKGASECIHALKQAPQPIADQAIPVPDILFDGYAVLQALTSHAKTFTTAENVSAVLDAVVRLIRKAPQPIAAPAAQVGCEGDDGLLRIHAESETCDVCSSQQPVPALSASIESDEFSKLAREYGAAVVHGNIDKMSKTYGALVYHVEVWAAQLVQQRATLSDERSALDALYNALPDIFPHGAHQRFLKTGKWANDNSYAMRGHTGEVKYRADDMEYVYAAMDQASTILDATGAA